MPSTSSRPTLHTSLQLDILRVLRERAGLTQGDMARHCGLHGQRSHQTAGAWERGDIIPSRTRRAKFFGYLWDQLGLGNEPAFFEEVWEILVDEWDWEPISDREWAATTHQARPSHTQLLDLRPEMRSGNATLKAAPNGMSAMTSIRHAEHSLTVSPNHFRAEETRNTLVSWLLMNIAVLLSDKPVRCELRLYTLDQE